MKNFNVFVPWVAFWAASSNQVADLSKIKVALAPNCSKITEKYEHIFEAEVAKTEKSRELGLGNRAEPMKKKQAMLFVFDKPVYASFWMKNTLIPLQIAFINTKGRISNMHFMPVEKDPKRPTKTYPATSDSIAAIEVAPDSIPEKHAKFLQLCAQK